MKPRKTLFILCVILFCTTTTTKAQEIIGSGYCGVDENNITWQLTDDGILTLSGSGDMVNYLGFTCADCDDEPNANPPWYYHSHIIETVIIQEGIATIGNFAFRDCDKLISIVIPSSMTTIGDFAFANCNTLTVVDIPKSVRLIAENTFYDCRNLTEIKVDSDNLTYSSENGILYDKSQSILFFCPTGKKGTVTIPDVVTVIMDKAFFGCVNLTEVTIGSSVTTIGNFAFAGCDGLMRMLIPKSVTSIGFLAFHSNIKSINVDVDNLNYSSIDGILYDKLESILIYCPSGKQGNVDIPNSVTVIESYAFDNCSLTSITIPNSVILIENFAFYCTTNSNLTDIYVSWETPPNIDPYVFVNIPQFIVRLHIPKNSLSIYQNSNVWKNFLLVETETSVKELRTNFFEIYPNPILESFYVSGISKNSMITISDINGRIVLRQMISPHESILVSHLSDGVYFVNIKGEIKKIIKKR